MQMINECKCAGKLDMKITLQAPSLFSFTITIVTGWRFIRFIIRCLISNNASTAELVPPIYLLNTRN